MKDIQEFFDSITKEDLEGPAFDAWKQTEDVWVNKEFTDHDQALLIRSAKMAECMTEYYLRRYHEWLISQL